MTFCYGFAGIFPTQVINGFMNICIINVVNTDSFMVVISDCAAYDETADKAKHAMNKGYVDF